MAGKIIYIGCKLPHGIILEHPIDTNKKIELTGLNKIKIIGSTHSVTEVDADFWEQWIAAHKEFGPLKSGAIFVAKTATDLDAVAKEFEKRKTGFEPMQQNANGVKPADKS
jgi:hypothetical protein